MSDMLGLSEIFESPFTLCQMFVMLNCGIVTFLYSFICRTCLLLKRATLAAKADLQQDLGQGGTAGAGLGFDQHALWSESHFFPFLTPCNNGMYDVHSHDMRWGHIIHVNTMNGCKNDGVRAERRGGCSFLCGTQEEREERKGEHGGTKQTTRVRRLTAIAVVAYRYTGSERGEQRSASWEGLQSLEPLASQLRGQFGWNMHVCCYICHHDAGTFSWLIHINELNMNPFI